MGERHLLGVRSGWRQHLGGILKHFVLGKLLLWLPMLHRGNCWLSLLVLVRQVPSLSLIPRPFRRLFWIFANRSGAAFLKTWGRELLQSWRREEYSGCSSLSGGHRCWTQRKIYCRC